MGDNLIEKFEEQLKCPICLQTFEDPKLLLCFHVLCRKCLARLVVRDEEKGIILINCPVCRHQTPGEAATLQAAFMVEQFLDILNDLKSKAWSGTLECHEEVDLESLKQKKKQQVFYCSRHKGKEMEYFCECCEDLICSHCVIKHEPHANHDYSLLDTSFDKYVQKVSPYLSLLQKQLEKIKESVEHVQSRLHAVSEQQEQVKGRIHNTFQELHEVLTAREEKLVQELDRIVVDKRADLKNQKERLGDEQAKVSSCLGFVRDSLQTSTKADVLKMKSRTFEQAKRTTRPLKPSVLLPCTDANISFLAPGEVVGMCQEYGSVTALASPSQCYASGSGLEDAKLGESSSVELEVIGIKGEADLAKFSSSLQCEIKSELTGTSTNGILKQLNGNQFRVTYRPQEKGKHTLQIKLRGEHIKGSPFPIIVSNATVNIRDRFKPLVVTSALKKPCGIAVTAGNNLIVTDLENHCTSAFSPDGTLLFPVGAKQTSSQSPHGVTIDAKGNIYVVDSTNHCLTKYDQDGRLETSTSRKGSGNLKLQFPTGIAYNKQNELLYIVDNSHQVQIMDTDLEFVSSFGRYGTTNAHFKTPWAVACDSLGKVYVADVDTKRIQVFTSTGDFLRSFNRSTYNCQVSLAIDPSGHVYVSEESMHRVTIFNSSGKSLSSIGSRGKKVGELSGPLGVAVDPAGVVYVCDGSNGRLQMFM